MDLPEDFGSRQWWFLVAVTGAPIIVASHFTGFLPSFLLGLAFLLCGVGRWIDHKTTGQPWPPTLLGGVLSACGVGFFGFGIYRLVALYS